MLLIDESLCVRCDNCEKACADTHEGTSRLNREGGPDVRAAPRADVVPPLRAPALHEGLPAGRDPPRAERRGLHPGHLHRLRQLRAQLPVQRDPDGAEGSEAARAGLWSWLLLGAGDGARARRQNPTTSRCPRWPSSATCARASPAAPPACAPARPAPRCACRRKNSSTTRAGSRLSQFSGIYDLGARPCRRSFNRTYDRAYRPLNPRSAARIFEFGARTRLFSRRPHCASSRLACQAPPWSA